ncbi:MAG TPA: SAVED domain-containing protein [Stellaceae bacterium]|nr:SAVED domain-containing protein [Stellaceae bacterium]
MTQAVTARRDGDSFQARIFWLKAVYLLDPTSPVAKVGFESGPGGFDDIWVEYDPPISDQKGKPLRREHIQCKWHVTPGSYGYVQVADPEFVNANARSLLQRALAAQRSYAPAGEGARFRFISNWRIDRADPLRKLVNERSHTLRVDMLYGTATERSAMGQVRKFWRDHLGVDETELRALARTLAFSESGDSLDGLRERLDPYFGLVGLRRIPPSESAFIYDDVVFQWAAQGRLEFTRGRFRGHCEKENLIGEAGEGRPRVYGVKSFEHATDRLEDRCTKVLDLVPKFADRQIRPDADWSGDLYPTLKAFLLDAAKDGGRLQLVLDAHLTLSFAAGAVLNIKSGRMIELEQRTIGKKIWAPDDLPPDAAWPRWIFRREDVNPAGNDIVIAVSLTHDVATAVRAYVGAAMPAARVFLEARLFSGPGARSVICGRHAFDLAESLTGQIKAIREASAQGARVHLFMAAPGGFSFFLGQRQIAIGALTLYEYDYEGEYGGSYRPSLSFPVGS